MPIEFTCSECGKTLRTPDDSGGKNGRCPDCGSIMVIPAKGGVHPSSPASQKQPTQKSATESTAEMSDPLGPGASPSPRNPLGVHAPSKLPLASPTSRNPYQSPNAAATPYGARPSGPQGPQPKTGVVLTLGTLSLISAVGIYLLVCCCWPLSLLPMLVALGCGIPAWLVGQQELKKFKAGVYAGRGKGEITAGYIFGILGVVLSLLSIVAFIVLIVQGISLGANDPSAF
ncbi:MAG: hypothetical protein VXZ63_04695 [Planctomycetota bacterium]|nr:hypothetical protein [Planctomycetota bacterium]